MNKIAKEMRSYLGISKNPKKDYLMHRGVSAKDGAPGRGSGRYPLGSGKDPYQHDLDFIDRIDALRKTGWTETPANIMKEFGMTSGQYIKEKSICKDERRMALVARAKELKKQGYNTSQIGREMGKNESTIRSWFNEEAESRMLKTRKTADMLKKEVDEKRMIDVGKGIENEIGISKDKLNTSLRLLEKEGYHVYVGKFTQPTNINQKTFIKVLAKPDVEKKEIYDFNNIKTINNYVSSDGGDTFHKKFTYPESLDSKRLMVRYKEDGGIEKDGIVELRRNVPDLSLGNSRYAQVRILVDKTHYIKGMAVYSDNMPDGVDVVFNTNKKRGTPICGSKATGTVLKEIKKDPDNPFGSNIKDADLGGQYWYKDKNGKEKLGLINKRADQGDWSEWKDSIPSQFLSKQSNYMAEKQLNLAKVNKVAEFDEIMALNNPTVKKYYLKKFSDECDAAAVDLKAAALPGQKYHVIIPINSMGDSKVFAPQYEDGTKLALIRYPHGGIFEIPILTVDNKNKIARKLIGTDSQDAVGISHTVAEQLSGADFDGDTVMCIPTHDPKGKVKIANKKPIKELQEFDNKLEYGPDKITVDKDGKTRYSRCGREYDIMKNTQKEMGVISNLITDMTLEGASEEEIVRAVKHSMVVIDAEKHRLDYKQSYKDNNIDALKRKYQVKYDNDGNPKGYGGAATIISKAKGERRIERPKGEDKINIKGKPWYDPNKPEGALIKGKTPQEELYYPVQKKDKDTGKYTVKMENGKSITYDRKNPEEYEKYAPVMKKDKNGNVYFESKNGEYKYQRQKRTLTTTAMGVTDDANTLVSKNKYKMELLYADYANSMKDLANRSRKAMVDTPNLEYNPKAKKIFKKEVDSLTEKINIAMKNKPKERSAQMKANMEVKEKIKNDPTLNSEDIKKLAQRAVAKYRNELGAVSRRDRNIKISDREWEAIQAGAISNEKLKQILDNSDPDILRERAMPKNKKMLNASQISRIKAMNNSNFTLTEIAKKMNVSTSTIVSYLKGAN